MIPNSSIDMLGGSFNFRYAGTSVPRYASIRMYNTSGFPIGNPSIPDYLGLADIDFSVVTLGPIDVVELSKYADGQNNLIRNANIFEIPSNVGFLDISLFFPDGSGGVSTGGSSPVRINIVQPEDVFTVVNSSGNTCQEYDQFQIDIQTTLPGFCGTIWAPTVSRHPNDINDPNDPLNEIEVVEGQFKDLDAWDDYCDNIIGIAGNYLPKNPITYGCKTYVFSYEIWPCWSKLDSNSTDPDNPFIPECPIIKVEEDITICCNCDIRAGGFHHSD